MTIAKTERNTISSHKSKYGALDMADLQKQFIDFHADIRLGTYTNNPILSDKRNLIIRTLRTGLAKQTEDDGLPTLTFTHFDQGSYAMHTGTKPLHKGDDYDIDVGFEFDLSADDCSIYRDNAVLLKKRVRNAISNESRTVGIKEPCVTVQYHKDGKPDYHVDMAIYRTDLSDHRLARGKEFSSVENISWDKQDPKNLKDQINNKQLSGKWRDQYRRVIKNLKRWNDSNLSTCNVPNIALTLACYNWFQYSSDFDGDDNDLMALRTTVKSMQSNVLNSRLKIMLPVHPFNDILADLNDVQMDTFLERLDHFEVSLIYAIESDDAHEASKKVASKLTGFPIVKKESTAKKAATTGFAVTGTSA
jgi:hypothetical protein